MDAKKLTDEEIDLIANDGMRNAAGGIYSTRVYEFARGIESAVRAALAHSDAVQAPIAWMLQEPGQSKRWYTSGEAAMQHWVSKGASATPLYAAPVAPAAASSTPTKISDVQLNEAIQAAERKLGIVWFVPDDSDTFAWRTTNTNERSKFARALVDALQGAAQ